MTCESGKYRSTELNFIILDPEHWILIVMTSLEGQKNFGIKQRKFVWPPRLPLQNQGLNTKLALAHIVNDFIERKSSSKECSGQLGEEKKPKSNRQLWEEGCKAALPRPEEDVFMPRPSVSVNARRVTCLPVFK